MFGSRVMLMDHQMKYIIYRPNGTLTENGELNKACFSADSGRIAINDETNPNSFLIEGDLGGLNIYDIGYAEDLITFNVFIGRKMINILI